MFRNTRFSFAKRATLLSVLASLFIGTTSVVIADTLPEQVTPVEGKTYFTRYNFWVEKERHVTTNYSRGEMIPINTRATVESIGSKKMILNIDGRRITVVNVRKHTQRDTAEIASEMLSPISINMADIPESIRGDVKSGILRLGMTKEQALMTRGYPPRHKTPTIKASTWVYWSSKFVQLTIVFENGKISRGRGLH